WRVRKGATSVRQRAQLRRRLSAITKRSSFSLARDVMCTVSRRRDDPALLYQTRLRTAFRAAFRSLLDHFGTPLSTSWGDIAPPRAPFARPPAGPEKAPNRPAAFAPRGCA